MPETAAKPRKQPATRKTTREEKVARPGVYEAPVKAPKKASKSTYTVQMANLICIRLSEGESLKRIVMDEGMPDRATVYRWLLEQPAFCDKYARAREEQADTLADEIIAIADENPVVTELKDREGNVIDIKIDSGYVAYQKQRIEARKWTAMKLKPKKYGDKLELAGDPNNPMKMEVQVESDNFLATILKNAELKKQVSANEN
jgi:hypothetical protein